MSASKAEQCRRSYITCLGETISASDPGDARNRLVELLRRVEAMTIEEFARLILEKFSGAVREGRR